MGFYFESVWLEVFVLATTLVLFVTGYFHNAYKYWERKGVPTIPPKFPLGNTNILLPQGLTIGVISKDFYDEFKRNGHRFGGVYLISEPNLIVVDPELVKDVLIRDFQHFVDRGLYYNKQDDPISANLFFVDGVEWRPLRIKMSPTFTSGKMKSMFEQVVKCSEYMVEAMEKSVGQDIEIKEVLGRFTTDAIGSCAFGFECNSFKYPDAEFRRMGKRSMHYSLWRQVRAILFVNFPKLAKQLRIVCNNVDVQLFFHRIVAETIATREEKNIRRNDFVQILMDMKQSLNITMDEITAQVFLFFVAGFETSSTAMNFGLYELARNQDMQERLRREVVEVLEKHGGQYTYESLSEMKYLDQVFNETLRMYPPLVNLNRRCTTAYKIPDTDIVLEAGTPILIPTLGLHRDPEYFPDPDTFNPERFSDENKKKIHPYVFIPFGDGPRNCLGLRFGTMQSKIGIASIVKNFKLSVSPKTKEIEFNPYLFLLDTLSVTYLRAEKI